MPIAMRGPRKAVRGKCERGQGSANADGAGAEAFAGDGYSQKASFGPMAAISRRGQGGRIYNNTRARVLLRRMCVKPAALTTHSPLKISARPRTATRPPRALPLPHAAPTHARRLRDARPPTSQPTPRRRPPLAPAAPTHARRLRDARPPTSPPIPRRRPPLAPAQRHALAEHFRPPRSADARPRSPEPRPQAVRCTPADRTTHSPHSAALPLLLFRFGHKKTAPHSACAMPNVSVDRRCGRSFGLVSRALFAAVAGRWRVGVGLRPQPWALRSRRCGRVLRA